MGGIRIRWRGLGKGAAGAAALLLALPLGSALLKPPPAPPVAADVGLPRIVTVEPRPGGRSGGAGRSPVEARTGAGGRRGRAAPPPRPDGAGSNPARARFSTEPGRPAGITRRRGGRVDPNAAPEPSPPPESARPVTPVAAPAPSPPVEPVASPAPVPTPAPAASPPPSPAPPPGDGSAEFAPH